MAKYIKSHSNYTVKKKHQNINDGVIFERDFTTIGGLDQFAKGQTPIYRSGNFIITVGNNHTSSRVLSNTKWEENEDGEYWCADSINDINSGETLEIEIKRDYRKLKDFAYYGSCAELMRGSVSDIIARFPGELYAPIMDGSNPETGFPLIYADKSKSVENPITKTMGDEKGKYKWSLDNPFGINIYYKSVDESEIDNPLRYFANDGFKDYEVFEGCDEECTNGIAITNCAVERYNGCEANDLVYEVQLYGNKKGETCSPLLLMEIGCFLDDGGNIVYLVGDQYLKYRIRPKKEKLNEFFRSLDSFQKALLNLKSKPLYTARFEIIKESSFGYKIELDDFTFPTTYGGYNLDARSGSFDAYVNRLVNIGEYYDEYFCDNMYRCMTHEAVKNFDWTFTRDYSVGEEDDYVDGGTKIQKLIRLFAREFDEIRQYIDGIKDYNRLSYFNEKGTPNYFLTDLLETEGWDIKNIYPFVMNEYYINDDNEKIQLSSEIDKLIDRDINDRSRYTNHFEDIDYVRTFQEQLDSHITPYSNQKPYWVGIQENQDYDEISYGVIINLDENNKLEPYYGYYFEKDDIEKELELELELTYPFNSNYDSYFYNYVGEKLDFTRNCGKKLVAEPWYIDEDNKSKRLFSTKCGYSERIKEYTSEYSYSMNEVNNHFMKMLRLNSRNIISKKGTIEGIETMLSLFGLKSKRWYESLPEYQQRGIFEWQKYDYEIEERITLTNGIKDEFVDALNMHKIDWYNYTKTVQYNNSDYLNNIYNSYQGLPIRYYDVIETNSNDEEEKCRYLYPFFDKNKELDGHPYFQMNGGWLSKKPFIFDKDNNMIESITEKYMVQTDADEGEIVFHNDDNVMAIVPKNKWKDGVATYYDDSSGLDDEKNASTFTHTFKTIKSVQGLTDLLNLQDSLLRDGIIYYVKDLSTDYVLIEGEIFELFTEKNIVDNCSENLYIKLRKLDGVIRIGLIEFAESIVVSNPHGTLHKKKKDGEEGEDDTINTKRYNLVDIEDGTDIKCYLIPNNGTYVIRLYDERYELNDFTLFKDGKFTSIDSEDGELTNYFMLNNKFYKNELSTLGWSQLSTKDREYKLINTQKDYYMGNNPHGAEIPYDNGYEYISYFTHLFKYADENNEWDDRCYESYYATSNEDFASIESDRSYVGFHALVHKQPSYDIDTNTLVEDHNYKTLSDSKVHYFGDKLIHNEGSNEVKKLLYASLGRDTSEYETYGLAEELGIRQTIINGYLGDESEFERVGYSSITFNNVTDQIVNLKVMNITFYLRSGKPLLHSSSVQEIKYIDEVVLNYLSQMLPPNVIAKVTYKPRTVAYTVCTDADKGNLQILDENGKVLEKQDVKYGKCLTYLDFSGSEF